MEAVISGHPQDTKKVSLTILELAFYGNVTIQNLYGSSEKQSFVNAAISRAARLQECLFGELPRYIKMIRKKSDPLWEFQLL